MPTLSRTAAFLALLSLITLAAGQDNSTVKPFWLQRTAARKGGCKHRPWVCFDRRHPLRKRLCCRSQCVDVGFDESNCGICKLRCPFGWNCCMGICVNTNVNPFHCGSCFVRCSLGVHCRYGICGYAMNVTSTDTTLYDEY